MVNNFSPKILLTDEDQAIIKAVDIVFVPHGTKHTLCLWHLMKNLVKSFTSKTFKWNFRFQMGRIYKIFLPMS
jgi:hypothetical protein